MEISGEQLHDWRARALRLEEEVSKAILGQQDTIRLINVALFARGHVLLEGDVGVGKTTILRAFARAIGGQFRPNLLIFLGHRQKLVTQSGVHRLPFLQ